MKILSSREIIKFGRREKLNPQYIRPTERVGTLVYKLALPPSFMGDQHIFHISELRKYIDEDGLIPDVFYVELGLDLSFEQRLMAIADITVKELKNHTMPLFHVSWDSCSLQGSHGNERMTSD